ncbi:hypothetical protein BN3661_02212 [Eubacteriaceae bacterium CHKCI005]|nr:hypothetical protein BN3661_02212 [Eubacteriaceae bacterium CHKCI005]
MKLQYGYTKKEVKQYKMSMSCLILTIAQHLIQADEEDMEIRLTECFSGSVERYDCVRSLLSQDWPPNYEVNVYAIREIQNADKHRYLNVVFADNVQDEDELLK